MGKHLNGGRKKKKKAEAVGKVQSRVKLDPKMRPCYLEYLTCSTFPEPNTTPSACSTQQKFRHIL